MRCRGLSPACRQHVDSSFLIFFQDMCRDRLCHGHKVRVTCRASCVVHSHLHISSNYCFLLPLRVVDCEVPTTFEEVSQCAMFGCNPEYRTRRGTLWLTSFAGLCKRRAHRAEIGRSSVKMRQGYPESCALSPTVQRPCAIGIVDVSLSALLTKGGEYL